MKRLVTFCIVLGIVSLVAVGCDKASTMLPNETGTTPKAPIMNGLTRDLMKVSNDGYGAIRAMHTARIAIFNGDTKLANEMLENAQNDLDAATKDAHTFAVDSKAADHEKMESGKSATDKMDLIPIDGGIAIADTFVPSAEKKVHTEKANEHLKSGRSKEAIEELRLGEIDVVYTRVLLPLETTKKQLADAKKFASEHKYYEANLALKAAEDGVVYDAVNLLGTSVPASTASAATPTNK